VAIPISYNLRNLFVRRTSTAAAMIGIGLVVTVFILVMALAQGFTHAVKTSGSEKNVLIVRDGSTSEVNSGLLREETDVLSVRPEIARGSDDKPLAVAELVILVVLPRIADGAPANVTLRGTNELGLRLRDGMRILDGGRMFNPGLNEIVVGKSLAQRIAGLGLGQTVKFKKRDWKVVGILDAGGTAFDSEVWGDSAIFQSAFGREAGYQSMTLRMSGTADFAAFKESLEKDPKLQVDVKTERQYYSDQTGFLGQLIQILGVLITAIMSLGAVLGAANTMYAAVGSRAREVATLRALGFGCGAVLVSFMVESLIISAAGGILGCVLALPINGMTTSTTNWDTFSELSFAFRLTPAILWWGFFFALVMGTAGGLLPALRAARMPITSGLRQG